MAEYYLGKNKILYLGNLDAKRDWGSAKDYVKTMWMMLQKKKPTDYVIASGKSRSVREFVKEAFGVIGVKIKWQGKGLKEVAIDKKSKTIFIRIKRDFFRPTEIKHTYGNSNKAKKILNWKAKTNFKTLVKIMCDAEIEKYN